jgi:aminopeptidase-like protein
MTVNLDSIGNDIWSLCSRLFPICRSITGDGVRQTLDILGEIIPITIHEVPSGTQVFDWIIPKEWNIRDAYIADENGYRVVDFKKNNLHVVGYSIPVDALSSLSELEPHIYSIRDQPDAIPYVTSYYEERWGFCLSHNERLKLKEGKYHVFVDSDLKKGHLTYAELIVPGKEPQEIFFSTYICHPSMANNEISGPAVMTFIASWLASQANRYTYRIIFIPETIGALTYLAQNLAILKQNVLAGFNITCVGDERAYSYIGSRYGNSLADKTALNVLSFKHPDFIKYDFLARGSDERQYCSPGIDLPIATICRSKFGTYPEYHTSLDNLDIVTPAGLEGSYNLIRDFIEALEHNKTYKINCLGEPQLGKRGLYPTLSVKTSGASVKTMMDFIAYADGTNDLIDISNIIGKPVSSIWPIAKKLHGRGLLDIIA